MSHKNGKGAPKLRASVLPVSAPQNDAYAAETYPTLLGLLSPMYDADKCVRLGGRLSIRVNNGYYVVTVSCPTEGKKATVIIPTLEDFLKRLEDAVRSPSTSWLDDYESEEKARRETRS